MKKQVKNPMEETIMEEDLRREALFHSRQIQEEDPGSQHAEEAYVWQRFSVICDRQLVAKLRLIAKKEHFSIREVLEYWLRTGIEKYESEHGVVSEDSPSRVVTDVFK